jgi:hypothetical protein
MIETSADCIRFLAESSGEWIVHVVPVEEGVHPADNAQSILFIKVLSTEKTYYFAPDHPDSTPSIRPEEFLNECLRHTKNLKWALDRKAFLQLIRIPCVYDANLCGYLKACEAVDANEFNTSAHDLVQRNSHGAKRLNRIIPLMKHLEAFEDMCKTIKKMIGNMSKSTLLVNDVILETLGYLEQVGICVDPAIFGKYFQVKPNASGRVFSQYNIYTSTGRPSNRFGGVNYAALNTKDGSRASFVSRYGKDGRMVVVDHTAFHPRIVCKLTGYHIPVGTDIYGYLAKLYFQKKSVDDMDITEAKKLTFRQLYGGVEEKYIHIKYLANLKAYIDEQWEFFQKNGYVLTPFFKRKITDKHITEPDPPKVFNYILQAAEGEIAISKLQEVQMYLASKKTKAVLYTYDAVLYDFHKDDGLQTLNRIREIMSFDGIFPMKTYIGENYHSVKQISL